MKYKYTIMIIVVRSLFRFKPLSRYKFERFAVIDAVQMTAGINGGGTNRRERGIEMEISSW